jgi:hypothetical protein
MQDTKASDTVIIAARACEGHGLVGTWSKENLRGKKLVYIPFIVKSQLEVLLIQVSSTTTNSNFRHFTVLVASNDRGDPDGLVILEVVAVHALLTAVNTNLFIVGQASGLWCVTTFVASKYRSFVGQERAREVLIG